MPVLFCAECGGEISATHKKCPHCGTKVRLWNDIRRDVEKSRLRLALVVIGAILLVSFGWFLRMDGGYKIPLYVILVIVAPVVPWLLSLAYKSAAPVAEKNGDDAKSGNSAGARKSKPHSPATIKIYGPGMGPADTGNSDKGN